MKLSDFSTECPFIKPLIKRVGDLELYPPQIKALRSGFLKGHNLLLASPTSSGKTLIAEVAMLANKGKCVYLVPLKSLAQEKFNDFSELFNGLLSVGLSVGDLTTGDERLGNNDLIVCSYEKFDSLLRHKVSWINDVSLVIVDEVHLIDDINRGPVIEVLLTRLKNMGLWIVALSATIGNPEEFAEWLGAKLVVSDFRPVKLLEGVFSGGSVVFKNSDLVYDDSSLGDLCSSVISRGKQLLVFVGTRRSTMSVAERLGKELSLPVSDSLIELSDRVLHSLSSPTAQCRRLAECVKRGVVFDHAGLVGSQKSLIESAFRSGLIKVIVCTTVLAYGVSLPAYMVVIRDFKRFTSQGMIPIPVSEYLQVAGRAGRSGFDVCGESVVMVGSDVERELAWNNYLCAKPTELVSKLGVEQVLRFHSLSLICDGSASSVSGLVLFFKGSFFGFSYGDDDFLGLRIKSVVSDLIDWGLVKLVNSRLVPSHIGLRVNELYIDPLSAKRIIDGLADFSLNSIGFLQLAVSCSEVFSLRVRKSDYSFFLEELALNEERLFIAQPNPFDYEYELFLNSFKTAFIIEQWVNERGEDYLLDEFGVAPGVLRRLINSVEWVLYAIGEIAELIGKPSVKPFINGLITRVRYGVKSELLTLISLRGVGRVRARKLYANGFKSVSDVKHAGFSRLSGLLGSKVARSLLDSLG